MRFLIHSNHPALPTGYGVQTKLLARRLKAAGHDVAIHAYVGQVAGIGEWEEMPVYPMGYDQIGNDILHMHADHWFGGDTSAGWIITLTDVFGLHTPMLADFQVAAWTPVDHMPFPPDCMKFFQRNPNARPIAMSQWGEAQLRMVGLDPLYAPLAFDPAEFGPIDHLEHEGRKHTPREVLGVDEDRFVVMMNGMNKGWAIHRKGWPEAFMGFAKFAEAHPEALLYVHSEIHGGAGGYDLANLATMAGVAEHQIRFAHQYPYRLGMPPALLNAYYNSADVLLAPSYGEGFCVPLIEAQAAGTPVIVTDFSAQPELVGAGWKLDGQPYYDAAQQAWMVAPKVDGIVGALQAAWEARDDDTYRDAAIAKAAEYEADRVFDTHWQPILEALDPPVTRPDIDRSEELWKVAVVVPVQGRPQNVEPLATSFRDANDGTARLVLMVEADDEATIDECERLGLNFEVGPWVTFAEKVNRAYEITHEPWMFLCGDDVRFHRGWLAEARKLSDTFDVIGTNDSVDGGGNAPVQAGAHADHFFVRRSYIDEVGASLDGPGVLAHEGYRHYFVDKEIVELAKRRNAFSPCLSAVVEHLHPGLDRGEGDATYESAGSFLQADKKVYARRAALIAQVAP